MKIDKLRKGASLISELEQVEHDLDQLCRMQAKTMGDYSRFTLQEKTKSFNMLLEEPERKEILNYLAGLLERRKKRIERSIRSI